MRLTGRAMPRAGGVGETVSLSVRVTDAEGRPAIASPVNWSAPRGTVPAVDSTDDNGVSKVTMTLPETPGIDDVVRKPTVPEARPSRVTTQPVAGDGGVPLPRCRRVSRLRHHYHGAAPLLGLQRGRPARAREHRPEAVPDADPGRYPLPPDHGRLLPLLRDHPGLHRVVLGQQRGWAARRRISGTEISPHLCVRFSRSIPSDHRGGDHRGRRAASSSPRRFRRVNSTPARRPRPAPLLLGRKRRGRGRRGDSGHFHPADAWSTPRLVQVRRGRGAAHVRHHRWRVAALLGLQRRRPARRRNPRSGRTRNSGGGFRTDGLVIFRSPDPDFPLPAWTVHRRRLRSLVRDHRRRASRLLGP